MSNEIKPVNDSLRELRKLRDEIRVKMHLAEMDARTWWDGVEPRLQELESKLENGVDQAAGYADLFVDELTQAFRRVRERIQTQGDKQA